MSERIIRTDREGLATLTLNRPEKLNALDNETFEALDRHLSDLEAQTETIGCVVLRGAGRAFSAGADLDSIAGATVSFKPRIIDRLAALPQPTIAAVHGFCFTGALELALACDFIVTDPAAKFGDTHGKWGLLGAWGMAQRLPRRIGQSAAKRMMLTSRTVEGAEAHSLGLADVLAEPGQVDKAVAALAAEILANSWHTNFHTKRIMRETDGMALAEALAWEQAHYPGYAPDYPERVAKFSRK